MMLMLMVLAGAGLIADDLRSNSLQLYFARPIRKRDYLLGKAGVTSFFLLLMTLVPGTLFIILKLIFSGSLRLLGQYPWLPLAVAAYSLVLTVFFTLFTLAVSSLGKNRRFTSIMLFLIYIFSDVFFGVFYGSFRRPEFCWLSIKANLQQVGAAIFRAELPYDASWVVSAFILAALAGGAALLLVRRVRSVEVIR
jgi:ABC-2 type transport system permease protein